MKIRKLWIIEVVIKQIQIGNSVTYYTSSPSFALCIIFHKIMFSSLLMTEYIFVPCRGSIKTYLQLLYLGCMYGWNFSWGKMKILDFFSTKQMEVELANLCLIDHNLKNPNFLIFNRNLLKLSLTCFSHFSTPIKTNLISGWTSPLMTALREIVVFIRSREG